MYLHNKIFKKKLSLFKDLKRRTFLSLLNRFKSWGEKHCTLNVAGFEKKIQIL